MFALHRLAPAAALLFVPALANAQTSDAPPTPTEEPAPVTALPPPSPANVPPPESAPAPIVSEPRSEATPEREVAHGKAPRYVAYQNGRLVLRDPNGILEVSPQGLLQFDLYGYGGAGVIHYQRPDGTGLKSGVMMKRLRLELAGRVTGRWYFLLGIQSGGDQNVVSVQPLNNFIGVDLAPMLKVQVGQFRIPFTMDNSTGIRWGEFMERTLTARVLGAPRIRDLGVMAWGGTDRSALWWALGYFGGEGGNRPSTDNRGDVVGRVLFRPLWKRGGDIGQMHVGVSGRYGRRDRTYAIYDATDMRTGGNYAFWSPSYGSGEGATRIMPSGDQSAVAAEVFVPFCCIDFRGEVLLVRDGRREVFDSSLRVPTNAALWNNTERSGTLSGYSWYVQATLWPYGPSRMVGAPGTWGPPTTDHSRERALSIALRYEQVRAKYDSIDRSYRDDGTLVSGVRRGGLDALTTDIKVDVVQLAATYWATRHVRLVAQWSLYRFPGEPGVENQAGAPGSKPNHEASERSGARTLHEASARLQVSF